MKVEAAPFLQEKTIETTGAGDTFCASSLNYVLEHGLDNLTEENLKELLTFANAAASLITTRKGALRVMSTKEEVLDFMNQERELITESNKMSDFIHRYPPDSISQGSPRHCRKGLLLLSRHRLPE